MARPERSANTEAGPRFCTAGRHDSDDENVLGTVNLSDLIPKGIFAKSLSDCGPSLMAEPCTDFRCAVYWQLTAL
jgi:hypothetical protein